MGDMGANAKHPQPEGLATFLHGRVPASRAPGPSPERTVQRDAVVLFHGLQGVCFPFEVHVSGAQAAAGAVVVHGCLLQRPELSKELLGVRERCHQQSCLPHGDPGPVPGRVSYSEGTSLGGRQTHGGRTVVMGNVGRVGQAGQQLPGAMGLRALADLGA